MHGAGESETLATDTSNERGPGWATESTALSALRSFDGGRSAARIAGACSQTGVVSRRRKLR